MESENRGDEKPQDVDSDGFTVEDGDCNDEDAGIFPQASEVANDEVDQDCDGTDLETPEIATPDAIQLTAEVGCVAQASFELSNTGLQDLVVSNVVPEESLESLSIVDSTGIELAFPLTILSGESTSIFVRYAPITDTVQYIYQQSSHAIDITIWCIRHRTHHHNLP